jgi:hypothetical protein
MGMDTDGFSLFIYTRLIYRYHFILILTTNNNMDVDNINNGNSLDSVKVVMPNGVVKEVNPAQQKTVADLIKFCVDADGDSEDFGLPRIFNSLNNQKSFLPIPSPGLFWPQVEAGPAAVPNPID